MSAATTFDPDSPEAQRCRSLPLGVHTLHPSPTNPRTHFDVAELTESVRENGVMTPLLVRPWPADYPWQGDMPLYEIVAGERRWRAATAAGLQLVPGIVRGDLSTAQVVKLQLIENLQREDLHELDEAEGYERMRRDYGYTPESIAEAIHKSRSYVFARLKLLDLDPDSRRLFRGGSLPASTALLLARVPTQALRAKALKELTTPDYNGDIPSVRRAQKILRERYMIDLKNASFPINDKALPGGPCKSCPRRTGNMPADLFDDVKNANVCTDPDCHTAKAQAFKARVAAEAEAKGVTIINGAAARKMTGGYISDYTSSVGKQHTRIDAICTADPKQRTYAEILGEEAEVILVEHPSRPEHVPVIKNTVLAEKLKAAGIVTPEAKQAQSNTKAAEKLAAERAYRERLADTLAGHVAIINSLSRTPATLKHEPFDALLRLIVERLWRQENSTDGIDRLIKAHGAEGKNITERKADFANVIAEADTGTCWQLIVALLVVGETTPNDWMYSQGYKPERMERLAEAFGINASALRKAVDAERKAEAKAKTPAKPAKKPATPAAKKPLPPTPAAQAREETGAEKTAFAVGDRVRVRDEINDPDAKAGWLAQVCGQLGTVQEIYDAGVYVVKLDNRAETEEFSAAELEPAPEAAPAEEGEAPEALEAFLAAQPLLKGTETAGTPSAETKWTTCFGPDAKTGHVLGYIEDRDGKDLVRFQTDDGEILHLPPLALFPVPPAAAQAAPAGGNGSQIETNETPTATDAAGGTSSAGLIEMNEKPTAAATANALYIHPDDATLTWSGRGRRPKWIEAWQIKTGGRVEELRRGV